MPSAIPHEEAPPILDFSAFTSSDPEARALLVQQIASACKDKGFFQIVNHGIPSSLQQEVLNKSEEFFALSNEEKMKLDKNQNNYQRGYEYFGTQMLEAGTAPESKEAYYLGRDLPVDHPDVKAGKFLSGPNLWPEVLGDEWKKVINEYYSRVLELGNAVLGVLALGLGLDEDFFLPFTDNGIGTLRLVHYPPTPVNAKARGIGAHRDFGCLTLLLQDDVGGLQVQNQETQEWIDVKPVPGAYVVNLGNMMLRWTNHKYSSNLHRVINRSNSERYSVPFFLNGNPDLVFDCIPGCEDVDAEGGRTSRYGPISVAEFVSEQYATSYGKNLKDSEAQEAAA
ncbi:MAG: hypothetical protein M1818_000964 [Claussenomyces sp. TS43310]|nr:MAG: hypothetical protein M1818_000964 [Claussenomyces sp. TS43310]